MRDSEVLLDWTSVSFMLSVTFCIAWLSVIMLNVIVLSVVMMNVVAPFLHLISGFALGNCDIWSVTNYLV